MSGSLVECGTHGINQSAFVCKHLLSGRKVGFWEPFDSQPDGDYPDGELNAWCNECNKNFESEGSWNDAATDFAEIKLVCSKCFFLFKSSNLG